MSERMATVLNEDNLEVVQRYMPSNYDAGQVGSAIFIYGHDSHGWTLDDYVIPRLASGGIIAKEVPIRELCPVCGESLLWCN
jgi:hypothetical protein